MDVKVIIIGDVHIKYDNLPDIDRYINELERVVKAKLPDFIVVLGDILDSHEKVFTPCLNKAYELIEKLRSVAMTYVIIGNHDMCSNQEFLSTNHCFNGLRDWKNVILVDKIKYLNMCSGQMFVFCPYVYPGRFKEALDTLEEVDWRECSCIFAHQEMRNVKMGAIISVEGDEWPEDFPHIISGHIHSKQRIQRNIYYPGSSTQVAYGESTDNTIAFVTFPAKKDEDYILEEIGLGLPQKYIVYKTIEDVESLEIKDSEDKIKLSVSGKYEEFKSFRKTKKYKELIESGVKVVFKQTKAVQKTTLEKLEKAKNFGMESVGDDGTNFQSILYHLVREEKNVYLSELYEYVVNDKVIAAEDMMFV
jgi:DNA repair exonuclease SbcCD nuclease subunit